MSAGVSAPPPVKVDVAQLQKWDGGRKLVMGAGGVGLAGLALTLVGMAIDRRAAMFSYLWAFAFWGGIALASVVLLQMFQAVRAKWMVVLRRAVEVMAMGVLPFLLLFLPIVVGLKDLYPWADPQQHFTGESLALVRHKAPYLNPTFFVIRGLGYLALASLVAFRLYGWSTRQDGTGDLALTARQRKFGTGALPFVALSFSFAGFDWLMSLQPLWFSTIFGVYFFAGSFISALSLLAIITSRARGKNLFGDFVSPEHVASVGKLMLAFTCFWAYIAFSQLLLIWIANLPEEIPFFIRRFEGGWGALGVVLIVGHFFIPFGAMLSRALKRDRRRLAVVGTWLLVMHAVDLYWLIIPLYDEAGKAGPSFHWTMVTAFAGIGGIAVAFGASRMNGRFSLPVRDPFLADSLAYKQP